MSDSKAPYKKPPGRNVHSSERHTVSVLVRCSSELKAQGRKFCKENNLTWAELIQAGIESMSELAR